MFSLLHPKAVYENIFELTPDELRAQGVSALICDLDDTLTPYFDSTPDDKLKQWAAGLTENGIRVLILTNGKVRRVTPACRAIGVPFIPIAMKPLPFGFLRALRRLGVRRKEAMAVGDQIFTDVIGANCLGIRSALVQPIAYKTSRIERWKRRTELPFRGVLPAKAKKKAAV